MWPIKSEGNSTFKAQELVRETEYEYEYELNYLPRRLVGHYDDGQICHPRPGQVERPEEADGVVDQVYLVKPWPPQDQFHSQHVGKLPGRWR